MRVKSLGAVVFGLNTMHVDEAMAPSNIVAQMRLSGAGTHIVYQSEILTPYITLNSLSSSWITKDQKDALELMWQDLDTTYTLTYEDDSTDQVRMAREKQLEFTRLTETNKDYYKVMIPLAKV